MSRRLFIIAGILVIVGFLGVYFNKLHLFPSSGSDTVQSGNMPRGVYALIDWGTLPQSETWQKPFVDGVVMRLFWRDLNPQPGVYQWETLDRAFTLASDNKKKVRMMIAPGFYSPTYILQDPHVAKATFRVPQGPDKGSKRPLPLPWDDRYLSLWFDFVDKVAQRYKNNPAFTYISATGPDSHNGEVSLPRDNEDEKVWLSLVNDDSGLLQTKLEGAWSRTFDRFCQDFSGKHYTLAIIDKSLPVRVDSSVQDTYMNDLVNLGVSKCGETFGLQTNGLDGRPAGTNVPVQWDLVEQYAGKILTGFQTRAPINLFHPKNVFSCSRGQTGCSKAELFQQAIIINGLSRQPNILEIYETNILDPELQDTIIQAHQALVSGKTMAPPSSVNSASSGNLLRKEGRRNRNRSTGGSGARQEEFTEDQ